MTNIRGYIFSYVFPKRTAKLSRLRVTREKVERKNRYRQISACPSTTTTKKTMKFKKAKSEMLELR